MIIQWRSYRPHSSNIESNEVGSESRPLLQNVPERNGHSSPSPEHYARVGVWEVWVPIICRARFPSKLVWLVGW